MQTDSKILLEKILSNSKTLIAFYPYRVAIKNIDDVIISTDRNITDYSNREIENFVNFLIHLGATLANYNIHNKTCVELRIEGIEFPVYCSSFDNIFYVTKSINYSKRIPLLHHL